MRCVEVVAVCVEVSLHYLQVKSELDFYPKLPYYERWGEVEEIDFLFHRHELLVMSYEFL